MRLQAVTPAGRENTNLAGLLITRIGNVGSDSHGTGFRDRSGFGFRLSHCGFWFRDGF